MFLQEIFGERKHFNDIKNLKKDSLVLLDDKGSKTNLSIDFMIENNFRIINETREQVLLTYDGN